jgi:endonuclease/exonuclease/phosphatase family metal-dependent hydrolase
MTFTLATFNVKDLLEPRSERARALLEPKLQWIARTVKACDADVMGLQEVGPPELLAAVLSRLGDSRYGSPVVGTADARGIRCALISRLPVLEARVHTADALPFPVFRQGDPPPFGVRLPLRRGVVQARVEAPGLGLVDVLVAHFKSSRPVPARDAGGRDLPATTAHMRAEGAVRSQVWRAAEALYVRDRVDEAMSGYGPDALLAVVGDLNDLPDSSVLRAVRGEGEGELYDCSALVEPSARFSSLHDGGACQIDHVLASARLYAHLEAARFLNADLREHAPVRDAPLREGGGGSTSTEEAEPPTIDSDHAPLVTRFR